MKAVIAIAATGAALLVATTTAGAATAEGIGRFVKPDAVESSRGVPAGGIGRWGAIGRYGAIGRNGALGRYAAVRAAGIVA